MNAQDKEKIPKTSSQVWGWNKDIFRHTKSQNICLLCIFSEKAFGGKAPSQWRNEPRKDNAWDAGSEVQSSWELKRMPSCASCPENSSTLWSRRSEGSGGKTEQVKLVTYLTKKLSWQALGGVGRSIRPFLPICLGVGGWQTRVLEAGVSCCVSVLECL